MCGACKGPGERWPSKPRLDLSHGTVKASFGKSWEKFEPKNAKNTKTSNSERNGKNKKQTFFLFFGASERVRFARHQRDPKNELLMNFLIFWFLTFFDFLDFFLLNRFSGRHFLVWAPACTMGTVKTWHRETDGQVAGDARSAIEKDAGGIG